METESRVQCNPSTQLQLPALGDALGREAVSLAVRFMAFGVGGDAAIGTPG